MWQKKTSSHHRSIKHPDSAYVSSWNDTLSGAFLAFTAEIWSSVMKHLSERCLAESSSLTSPLNTTADAQKNRGADRKRGRKEIWEFVIWWRGWKEADRESSRRFDKRRSRSFTITSHYIWRVQCRRFRPGSNDHCSNLRGLVTAWCVVEECDWRNDSVRTRNWGADHIGCEHEAI